MGLVSKEPEDEGEEEAREVLITGFGQLDEEGVDEIELDLADWSEPARAALDERLHLLEAPHEWNGTWLVVPEDSADWVERVIDQVEEERSVELDPDVEQIAYDLAGWDDGNRALLLHALEDEAIAFALEDDELIVHEIDEQRVDELVDAIVEPDAPPSGAGEARTEVMGELFVAADRLVHDPRDAAGQRAVRDGAQEAATHAPPYGMDKGWWESLGAQCASLVTLFDAPATDEDPIVEAATALRDVLRPYV